NLDALGSDGFSGKVRDLAGRALLDGNFAAIGCVNVNGREWGSHVERDAVFFGEHGNGVGADLVGNVAIGGNAVGADYDRADFSLLHDRSRHVVGDDGGGNAILHQFPGGEAGALQEGAGLVGEHLNFLA